MIKTLFTNKSLKSKERVTQLSQLLLSGTISADELTAFAAKAKDTVKAGCIEAIELATQTRPELVEEDALLFIIDALGSKAARVKWESAKVIANTIHLFPAKTCDAVKALLQNTNPLEGAVVRWSAASAIARVLRLKTSVHKDLIAVIEAIIAVEEKSSVKKIYTDALRHINSKG